MPASLPILPPTLPAHLSCYQELINEALSNAIVSLDTTGFTNLLRQTSTPSPTQRGYSWHNPNTGLIYHWEAAVSAWVSLHRYGFGSDARIFWTGSLVNLALFDGGDAGAIGDASGAMWIEDLSMAGKMAIGAGTLPSTAALVIGDTGGEDLHTMTIPELAAHTHPIQNIDNDPNTNAAGSGTGAGIVYPRDSALTDSVGSSTPFNVLNPYKAGTWAKRSSRIYYRA